MTLYFQIHMDPHTPKDQALARCANDIKVPRVDLELVHVEPLEFEGESQAAHIFRNTRMLNFREMLPLSQLDQEPLEDHWIIEDADDDAILIFV